MKVIKKGDLVGRISYGKDIIFVVDRIIEMGNNKKIAILKGITIRVKADSYLEDLEIVDKRLVKDNIDRLENNIEKRIKRYLTDNGVPSKKYIRTGKILHLDGDKRYSEKSFRYYKSVGLNAVVKNLEEYKQPKYVRMLLEKYNPEILVITGHDRND